MTGLGTVCSFTLEMGHAVAEFPRPENVDVM